MKIDSSQQADNLRLLCDCIVSAKRQHDEIVAAWRAMDRSNPDRDRAYNEGQRANHTVRSLLKRLHKLLAEAATPDLAQLGAELVAELAAREFLAEA